MQATKSLLCPPGWSMPWVDSMSLQDPTPVTVPSGDPDILPLQGWIVAGPLERIDEVLKTEILVADYWDGYVWHLSATDVQEVTGGCECGNPWVLCHPEA